MIVAVDPPLSINQNVNICAINVKLLFMAHHSIYVPTILSRQQNEMSQIILFIYIVMCNICYDILIKVMSRVKTIVKHW